MRLFQVRVLAVGAVAAFALAACGSSSKPSSSAPPATSSTAAPTTAVPATTVAPTATTVALASTSLGKVLVDAKGMTLYQFENDTKPGASTCPPGQCESTWPAAIVTGAPTAGAGVSGALTTFMRNDGKAQLQIAGHPLYTFAGDSKPGDTNGQKILDKWYATNGAGAKVGA